MVGLGLVPGITPAGAHQIARLRLHPGIAQLQIERTLEHVDELVLLWMNVQRHEGSGRVQGRRES